MKTARSKTPPSAVALEIAPHTAKIMTAALVPFHIQQVNASTQTAQMDDPVSALRTLLEGQPLGSRQVGILFGREMFSLRTLELPSLDPKEIASMLELQLGKLTPYPRAEILSAWTTIGVLRDGYTSVLLAVTRKALIEQVLQFLKAKGVQPQWVGVSTQGLESWWALRRETAAAPAVFGELTALIDVDGASTDCTILSQGRLLFTHSLTLGHEHLVSSDQAQLRWVGELVRLPRVLLHEGISGKISRGVMTGVTEGLDRLAEQLTSQWGVSVELADPLAPFAAAAAVPQRVQATRVSYAALAGVLASAHPPSIDLLPPEVRVSQALQVRSKHLARLAVSVTILLFLAGILYVERMLILSHYLGQLRQRLAVLEQTSHEVMERQEAMRSVRAWLDPSQSMLQVFDAVSASVVPEITITQLSFQEREPVTIRGKAETMPSAYAFFDRLKQEGTFGNVHARSVAKTRGANETGAEFEIVCTLAGS
ncbi:MAG: pilus assembly protein PilM [Candidatus Omnitrophota bacterium]|nr:pilus assembly protein PilM [Candidatus Omnitrophota bacterium]